MSITITISGYEIPVICACGCKSWTRIDPRATSDAVELTAMQGYVYARCSECNSLKAIWYANITHNTPARAAFAKDA